jgi:hypothetical protein
LVQIDFLLTHSRFLACQFQDNRVDLEFIRDKHHPDRDSLAPAIRDDAAQVVQGTPPFLFQTRVRSLEADCQASPFNFPKSLRGKAARRESARSGLGRNGWLTPLFPDQPPATCQQQVQRMPPGIEVTRRGKVLRDVVADEDRHKHQVGLVSPDVLVENGVVFTWSRPRDAEVVNLDAGQLAAEPCQVVVGKRHGRPDGERITQGGNAPNPRPLRALKIRPRIAETVAAQPAAVIAAGHQAVGIHRVADHQGGAGPGGKGLQGQFCQNQGEDHVADQ